MRAAALAVFLLAVIVLAYAMATTHLNNHHARWLRRHDQEWASLSDYERAQYRQQGLLPSWEMSDARLRVFVGDTHLAEFRHRHPVP